jgi:general secretion pathway protein N
MKAFLALIALALGGVLLMQWRDWPPPPPPSRLAPATPEGQKATSPNPVAALHPLEDKDAYAPVTERPLFRPDRRPRKDEPEAAAEVPVEEASDLAGMDLTGVLLSPKVTTAWVKDPSQATVVRLRQGEILAGWTVKDILADRLVLERQGKTDTILLRTFNAPGTAPAAPPTAAPQRPPAGAKPPASAKPPTAAGTPRPGVPGRPAQAGAKPPTGKTPAGAGTPPATRPGATTQDAQAKGPNARLRPPAGNPNARPNVRPPNP